MSETTKFITLHDGDVSKKRFPEGRPVRIRADAIDTLRPYSTGRIRTVVGIHGSYLHAVESEDQILYAIGATL